MNRKYYNWFIGTFIVYAGLFYFASNARFLYNEDFLYITIVDFDENIYASFLLSFVFVGLVTFVYALIKLVDKKLFYNRFSIMLLLLPILPAVSGLTRLLLHALKDKSNINYWSMGKTFALVHPSLFETSISTDEFVEIGKSLLYGGGLYLSILLFIVVIVNQAVVYYIYHKKFIKE